MARCAHKKKFNFFNSLLIEMTVVSVFWQEKALVLKGLKMHVLNTV